MGLRISIFVKKNPLLYGALSYKSGVQKVNSRGAYWFPAHWHTHTHVTMCGAGLGRWVCVQRCESVRAHTRSMQRTLTQDVIDSSSSTGCWCVYARFTTASLAVGKGADVEACEEVIHPRSKDLRKHIAVACGRRRLRITILEIEREVVGVLQP